MVALISRSAAISFVRATVAARIEERDDVARLVQRA
jgi:hypothetical protein